MPSTPAPVLYRAVATEADLKLAFRVRFDVFVDEQKVPAENELDEIDHQPTTAHFLAVDAATGEPLGTCRIFPSPDLPQHDAVLGRVATLAAARGRGVGKQLCVMAHDHMRALGFAQVLIHAQEDKAGFYAKLGYVVTSPEVFMEEGIPHVHMALKL
ncbi:hypothetical protein H9P43_008399 [Blastocladiella emersonii ATCC 22665]|nr:hypothetical protein H9P43_008399 [Blastocladiella emersonii ATCC 22665]